MSQFDFGTIDPNVKTGSELAVDLNSWRDALHSTHAGVARPAYAAFGMLWVDQRSTSDWRLMMTTTGGDAQIGGVNPLTLAPAPLEALVVAPSDANWATLALQAPAGSGTSMDFKRGTLLRWAFQMDTGPNDNLAIYRFDNSGNLLDSTLTVNRITGSLLFKGATLDFTPTSGNGLVRFFNVNGGAATHEFNANGEVYLKNIAAGATYTSTIGQYVPDSRLVIARDSSATANGSIHIYPGRIEFYALNSILTYEPGVDFRIQGITTSTAPAGWAAVWTGDSHAFRVCTSARRFKKDITPLPDTALDQVQKLKPVTYLSAIERDTPDRHPGFVAEDLDDAGLSDYVTRQDGEVMSVKYERVGVLLAKAMQELVARVAALEAK